MNELLKNNIKEKIAAVIPALDEEGKIGKVVSKINQFASYIDTILVVDDGSTDKTKEEAEREGALVIKHSKNMGVGSAIRTGIDYAIKNKFDIVVVMGGDDQDNPAQIKRLISPIIHDHFDFVQGSRYLAGGVRVNIPWFRWITTGFYSFIFKVIMKFPVSDGTNGFRAFRTYIFDGNKKINIWQKWLDKYELEPYLYYKVVEEDLKVTEAPVTKSYPKDKIGYTKMVPIVDWWSILRPLIYLKLGLKK